MRSGSASAGFPAKASTVPRISTKFHRFCPPVHSAHLLNPADESLISPLQVPVTPGNAAATSTLTISGSGNTANTSSHPLPLWTKIGGGALLALLIWPLRRQRSLYLWVLLLGTGALLSGCGSSESSTAKTTTSSVIVTASGGSISQSQPVTLAITQ
jgi:hypothetical protein